MGGDDLKLIQELIIYLLLQLSKEGKYQPDESEE